MFEVYLQSYVRVAAAFKFPDENKISKIKVRNIIIWNAYRRHTGKRFLVMWKLVRVEFW
jgi:hypothetical protein